MIKLLTFQIYAILLSTFLRDTLQAELCSLIEIGTTKDINDVIKLGVL